MFIYYTTEAAFYEGCLFFMRKGVQFGAIHEHLKIQLTGGF